MRSAREWFPRALPRLPSRRHRPWTTRTTKYAALRICLPKNYQICAITVFMVDSIRHQRLNLPVAPFVAAVIGGIVALVFAIIPAGSLEQLMIDSGIGRDHPGHSAAAGRHRPRRADSRGWRRERAGRLVRSVPADRRPRNRRAENRRGGRRRGCTRAAPRGRASRCAGASAVVGHARARHAVPGSARESPDREQWRDACHRPGAARPGARPAGRSGHAPGCLRSQCHSGQADRLVPADGGGRGPARPSGSWRRRARTGRPAPAGAQADRTKTDGRARHRRVGKLRSRADRRRSGAAPRCAADRRARADAGFRAAQRPDG